MLSAVEQLYRQCDPEVLAEIADAQKMRTTLVRLQRSSGEYGDFPRHPPLWDFSRAGPVPSAKLENQPVQNGGVAQCRSLSYACSTVATAETRRDPEDARCR